MNLKERAKQLTTDIPAVYIALKRRETPFAAKLLAAATIAYALSPVDLIPDFIPVIGYLDDLIILPCLIALTVKAIPDDVLSSCRDEAKACGNATGAKKWYYALPIIVFWSVIVFVIIKAFI